MKKFLDENFLLSNDTACKLYHQFAKDLPIIDYHCHINPKDIAENKKYTTITDIWLGGDHYKWRQIRGNGIAEKYITGDSTDLEKFTAWAKTLPRLIGNPLYHWSYLELKNYFDYTEVLNENTATKIFELCNEKLQDDNMSVRSIIKNSKVEVLCTTDDPIDSLEYHKQIANDPTFSVKVLPAFRPDKALNIEKPDFLNYIQLLSSSSSVAITSFDTLCHALSNRLDYFDTMGCKISDHALTYCFCEVTTKAIIEGIFNKRLQGHTLTKLEANQFKTALLGFLGHEYHQRNWAMQIHFGCLRDNNTLMYKQLGPDTGFDAIYADSKVSELAKLLDMLASSNSLPRTILYSLNPYDNEAIATIMGCFQGEGTPGKIQLGSAWWFNDTKLGITKQLTDLANLGMLANFIGMLTDSRSFLSYARHEYFRRILCDLIGTWAENGEIHNDLETLGTIVQDICYYNCKRYFNF